MKKCQTHPSPGRHSERPEVGGEFGETIFHEGVGLGALCGQVLGQTLNRLAVQRVALRTLLVVTSLFVLLALDCSLLPQYDNFPGLILQF